ncbi:MAG TPA: HEPN domain-containing protein [Longimicrobium sp.]|nr:HEPN domain-containing protein [Longimicrobium sp.]
MPSHALRHWQTRSRKVLDELEAAHAQLAGSSSRRFARQQIAQAYVVALSSQFQRFCRDLYSEAVDHFVAQPNFAPLEPVLLNSLNLNRRLAVGNANPGNIGADFGRFGLRLWDQVNRASPRNAVRQSKLGELNLWRNAVAHQDFTNPALGGRDTLRIGEVRAWRSACSNLAVEFDRQVGLYLSSIIRVRPW